MAREPGDCEPKREDGTRGPAEIVPLPWRVRRKPRLEPEPEPQTDKADEHTLSTRALVGFGLFFLIFIVFGVWLLEAMRARMILEECLMAGGRNCVPITEQYRER